MDKVALLELGRKVEDDPGPAEITVHTLLVVAEGVKNGPPSS